MKKIPLYLSKTEEVLKLVDIVNDFDYNCDLCCGSYYVDAKSLLGAMMFQGVSNVELIMHADEAVDLEKIIIEKFSVSAIYSP